MSRLLLLLVVAVALLGCGVRGEVAKDKVLAQVDSLLGEIDVKKKAAEIGVQKMGTGLDQLSRGKIEAKVKLTQISEKLAGVEGRIGDADKALGRLRDYLKEGKDAEISGKTYTSAQLREMADTTIAARKKLSTEADGLKSSKTRLDGVVTSLERQETDGRDKLRSLKQHLDEIDAKAVALKSIQDAARISGGQTTLDFASVEKQVHDLSSKIDVELTFQDEKSKQSGAAELASLDTIIQQTSTAGDTVSEIDKILAGK